MNQVKFEIDNKTYNRSLPVCWNDLSQRDLLFVAPLVLFQNSNIQLRRQIAMHLLKIPAHIQKLMNMSQLDALADTLNFLWQKNDLTNQKLPAVLVGWFAKMYGPEKRLENISGSEFAFAEKYMADFNKSRSEADLNKLVGCLYRPAAPKHKRTISDKRTAFSLDQIEQYAKNASKISLHEKLAIYTFYLGCRNFIVNKFKPVFSSKNEGQARKSKSGWLGFFYNIAGPKVGTFHKVADMNIYELLSIMLTMIEQSENEKLTQHKADSKAKRSVTKPKKR